MNRNYLPPLLRGAGTTIVLFAMVLSVIVARHNVQAEQIKREAARMKAEAEAAAGPLADRQFAELMAEVQDLQAGENDSVAEEVVENPWFNYAGFFGTATVASSFFVEAFQRRREKVKSIEVEPDGVLEK